MVAVAPDEGALDGGVDDGLVVDGVDVEGAHGLEGVAPPVGGRVGGC